MCLCEVGGHAKLQAACTLTAQDGLELRTAQTSEKAAEGQRAILEFILLNHPLDCPDCDKGGECPLQDLTFRLGPATTRMHFPKRTFDKPIPISPTITLDRERCILCYRCTRFSESVSEDMQLVAANRGAQSIITTFEKRAVPRALLGQRDRALPGRRAPPGDYRFRARPWEIDNVPTVCGLCPVGCNVWATTREGKVDADPLPEPSRGGRRVALRQGPLRVRPSPRLRPDSRAARPRAARAASSRSSWEQAVEAAASGLARRGGLGRRRVLGRRDRRAGRRARPARARRVSGPTRRSCPTTSIPRSTRSARPSRPSATPRSVSSSGTSRSSSARPSSTSGSGRRGATGANVVTVNAAGTVSVPPGRAPSVCAGLLRDEPARGAPRPCATPA